MLNYLYYKLYQVALKGSLKDIPVFVASIYLGTLIGLNVIVVYIFLVKVDLIPYLFTDTKQGGIPILLFSLLALIYYTKAKRLKILDKYSKESNAERKKGNAIVAVYVGLTFLAIFAIAFYKPGYLPR